MINRRAASACTSVLTRLSESRHCGNPKAFAEASTFIAFHSVSQRDAFEMRRQRTPRCRSMGSVASQYSFMLFSSLAHSHEVPSTPDVHFSSHSMHKCNSALPRVHSRHMPSFKDTFLAKKCSILQKCQHYLSTCCHKKSLSVHQASLLINSSLSQTGLSCLSINGYTCAPLKSRHQHCRPYGSALTYTEMAPNDYEGVRPDNLGPLSHKALLVDAAGTLLEPTEPVTQVYLNIGRKYGVKYSDREILDRYRVAYAKPWRHSILRYHGDARPFWQFVLSEATGCADQQFAEEVYEYYTSAQAWRLIDPEASHVFAALRAAGVKLAVVSNFDTRLRQVLRGLGCDEWFDALAVSAEVHAEKPNRAIFSHACDLLQVDPHEAVHVGDDRRNDVWGARDAGCDAWLWREDVFSFREVAERIGVEVRPKPPPSS
eukprot:TRINITY_DN38514_c0_g1_i1.p1 TRINITY_DN38514_c0_g1~~TRINITY_DN38514_c0_g1_i1.p1  ORF type:complete len:430 (-),score=15.84 TRINITY_DN38514_c0_g1_i1:390-1679(-)